MDMKAAGMVFRKPPLTCSRVVMAVPKGDGFRAVIDYCELIEQVATVMSLLEELGMFLGKPTALCA